MGFKKGQSGNPGGRPKKSPELEEVEALCKEASPAAVLRLTQWMKSDDAAASVRAALGILERAYGKPRQTVETTITDKRMVVEAPKPATDAASWASEHGPH